MWCRRATIPVEIFTGFAEFPGIVSVNDFRFPIWLQERLQAPLCFLKVFCFARIRLDPLGGQVLHHDCMLVIVWRFTTFTENLVICCYQVTKLFSTRYGSAFQHCAYPNPHVSCMCALQILHEKNWRVSLLVQEFHHPPNFLYSCSHSGISEHNGLPRSICGSFLRVFWILLPWFTTGCPDRSST